jgi:hypothetical protein
MMRRDTGYKGISARTAGLRLYSMKEPNRTLDALNAWAIPSAMNCCAMQNSAHQLTQVALPMPITDRAEFKRLILQIERDLLAQAQLRTLLTAADNTIAGHRQKLRKVKARIKRTQRVKKRAQR